MIVVDDASTDGTAEWVLDEFPWTRVVRLPTNGGFVAAANAGISAARGEFVQLLNNDAEVCEGWVAAGLEPFADPRVGSVAPLVLVRSDPSRVDSAGDQYAFVGWPSKRGHGEDAKDWVDRGAGPVFGASGSSAIYRSEALRPRRRLRPGVRIVLRRRGPGLPHAMERVRVPVCARLPNPPRDLRELRPPAARAPASDVAERRDPLLGRPARAVADPGAAAAPRVRRRAGGLANRQATRLAILARQVGRGSDAPRVRREAQGADPPGTRGDRPARTSRWIGPSRATCGTTSDAPAKASA